MAVETFLSNGPLTLDEIVSAIRVQSFDASSKPVFSDAEIKLAIRQAIANSYGKFFLSGTYNIASLLGDYAYDLPDYVHRVTGIVRDTGYEIGGSNTLAGTSVGQELHYFRHTRNRGTNTISLLRGYPTSGLVISYERDIGIPIDNRRLGAALTSGATTVTLVDADPQLYRVALPAFFKIDNEIIEVSAITGNTAMTITRGEFGSTAAAHVNGRELSQLVVADSDRFYNFLFQEAGRLLNEFRIQAGSQNVSVAANITAAQFFRENRDTILKQIPQTKKSRRMKFTRGRRPRRGVY